MARTINSFQKSKIIITTIGPFRILPVDLEVDNKATRAGISIQTAILIGSFVLARRDRGSYNLSKANKRNMTSSTFMNRRSSDPSDTPLVSKIKQDDIQLSPLSKSSKKSDTSLFLLLNGIGSNDDVSFDSVARYIPPPNDQCNKKKEVKEWYV